MSFYRRQAAAEDNPQLSTQRQQVSGELGINTSHSEAKKTTKTGFVLTEREMEK